MGRLSTLNRSDTVESGSAANCRNVMIDLMESGEKPAALKEVKKVGYRIEAAGK